MNFNRTLYCGRIAPSPTGYLHLGHARTFWIAQQRAREHQGTLILRNEDLDPDRTRGEFVRAMFEDLRWFGLEWQEGPDVGGSHGPYNQSERRSFYLAAFEKLLRAGSIYPCYCSRKDVLQASQAPHAGEEEPLYPGTCRHLAATVSPNANVASLLESSSPHQRKPNWRFRIPDSEIISFHDAAQGPQSFIADKDFGDFVVWRHDGVPAYQLAVVVDDAAMRITEVVRGADLLLSTARQLLLYRALGMQPPAFYHCLLLTDSSGVRLAKRHDALSLRTLRAQGRTPEELRAEFMR